MEAKGFFSSKTNISAIVTLIVALLTMWGVDISQDEILKLIATGTLTVSTIITLIGRILASTKIKGLLGKK